MKLLFSILLTTSLFAQDKSNQNSYAIETKSQYYQDVSIVSVVYGIQVEVYDRSLNTTLNIPITEIKSLKKNGLRPNMFATIFGTAAGAGCGAIAAVFAQVMFSSQDNTNEVAVIAWGGSIMLGYKLGSSISKREPKREHKVIGFEEWTLDEKRNYLKSIANQ
tara:strand:+ start:135 stop:623 length:489 start_codon:yes stop_codon:yes gene_type:complete